MNKIILLFFSIFLFLFIFNSVYSQELDLSILEDRAMTGYYESDGVLYPPESELLKQGLTLSSYKQSLKDTAPKNRNSSVDNIWGTSPLTGTIRIPVLLVQFTDKMPTTTQSQFNESFNSPTITADSISVSKYYYKQSYGQLNIIFDVYNWTTMPQTFAHYSATSNTEFQLIVDAVNTFNPTVNFAQYDNDNDGRLDGLVIIPAGNQGSSMADSNGIWPHARILRNSAHSVDDKYYGNAAIIPEKKSNAFQARSTFMHEFAHVLGLPDLYSINSNGGTNDGPINGLTMMIYNTNNCPNKPMNLDVWSRYFLGWINPVVLTTDSPKEINLRSVNDYPDAVILKNSNMGPREYFIIENRHKNLSDIENLDNCVFGTVPNGGTLIYHIDENKIEADYPNNWINWDPDANYFDDSSWPGITNEINYLPGGNYSTNNSFISYSNFSYNDCNFAIFDENNRVCSWRPFSMTTRSYSGNLNPLIRFEALTPRNEYIMTAKMLVGQETTTPTTTLSSGTYPYGTQATLITPTNGAVIYYTTNGTTPTTSSSVYTGPITLPSGNVTLKAIAKKNNFYVSDVLERTYFVVNQTVASPTSNKISGYINYNSQVAFSTTTPDAIIRYTIDGSEPNENSLIYSNAFTITETIIIKAKAYKSGWDPSATAVFYYIVQIVEPVLSNQPSGHINYGDVIALTSLTPNATIRYTLNGSTPDQHSLIYVSPINVTSRIRLKAIAYRADYAPSLVSTYDYSPIVGTPTVNKIGGQYQTPIFVKLKTRTVVAIIKYTLDGSEPNLSSLTYTEPILISSNTTLKAKAYVMRPQTTATIGNVDYSYSMARQLESSTLTEEYIFTRKINKLEQKEKETEETIQKKNT